jgi:hypothetical protein
MSTTPNTTAAAAPALQTWTFFGHWDESRIVVEYILQGQVQDDREDDGYWDQGLWCDSGTGATLEEARRNAIAPYEAEIHGDEDDENEAEDSEETGNPAYPHGRCDACGWGLNNGCANPDCERPGTKLPADDEDEDVETERYTATFTFDARDTEHAEHLTWALTDVIDTSDAVPVYGNASFTPARLAKTWPENDADRDDFAAWQHDVANGDTLRGYRDWQAEQALDAGLDDD